MFFKLITYEKVLIAVPSEHSTNVLRVPVKSCVEKMETDRLLRATVEAQLKVQP